MFHDRRGLACSIHSDDFTSTGPKVGLDCLEAQPQGKYELRKGGRLGPGPDDAAELTVLNRVLRYTPDGFFNMKQTRVRRISYWRV